VKKMNCIYKRMTRFLMIFLLWLFSLQLPVQAQPRWKVAEDGGITWEVRQGDVHQDHIEMSGKRVSVIVGYGVREDGSLVLTRRVAFPSLRTLPNDKSGTLSYVFGEDATPHFLFDGRLAEW
jgi:hypothetical protein